MTNAYIYSPNQVFEFTISRSAAGCLNHSDTRCSVHSVLMRTVLMKTFGPHQYSAKNKKFCQKLTNHSYNYKHSKSFTIFFQYELISLIL